MSQQQWYYAEGETKVGPVTQEQLGRVARAGDLSRGQMIWREGMDAWTSAASIPELFDGVTETAVPLAYAKAPDRNTVRITRNAKSNAVTMFVLFLLGLLPVIGFVIFTLARHSTAPFGIPTEVMEFGCFPFVAPGGIFSAIYLPARWKQIMQLRSPLNTLGLIGGIGLFALFLLQLGWLIVVLWS